jgi:hypothetical protein
MKITNKFCLPQTIVNALERPTYSKGKADISVTELIAPPQLVALKRIHADELESDASDMVWSLFGSAVHTILEQGADDEHLLEERLFHRVHDWTVSGAVDVQRLRDGGVDILDYKVVKAYSVMNEKIEWEMQLNCYAYLVRHVKKMPVHSLAIVAIVRDWSRREAQRSADYPQSPVVVVPVNRWSDEEQDAYVEGRIGLHQQAYAALHIGGEVQPCTPQEMWEKPTSWALMKEGRKTAVKVHWDKAPEVPDEKHYIEVRDGERTRCKSFCPVNKFCTQWSQYEESA